MSGYRPNGRFGGRTRYRSSADEDVGEGTSLCRYGLASSGPFVTLDHIVLISTLLGSDQVCLVPTASVVLGRPVVPAAVRVGAGRSAAGRSSSWATPPTATRVSPGWTMTTPGPRTAVFFDPAPAAACTGSRPGGGHLSGHQGQFLRIAAGSGFQCGGQWFEPFAGAD